MDEDDVKDSKKKLDFSRVGHCGRQDELDILAELCRRSRRRHKGQDANPGFLRSNTTGSNAILNPRLLRASTAVSRSLSGNNAGGRFSSTINSVLIEAESGTGKSALLDALCKELSSGGVRNGNNGSTTCYCCRGKFEERTAASEPFAAIREAMDALFRALRSGEEGKTGFNPEGLRKALGPDIGILISVLPNLKSLILSNDVDVDNTSLTEDENLVTLDGFGCNMTQMEWRFERLRFAIRALVRFVLQFGHVALVLDDLHWADPDSMLIIRTLIQDTTNGRRPHGCFTFVGAARPLVGYKHLRQLTEDIPRSILAVRGVSRLSTNGISVICCSLLEISKEAPTPEIIKLAGILKEKTGGNAFVLFRYLRLLEEKQLIYYDENPQEHKEHAQWRWDISRIEKDESVHENMTKVVADSIASLDECIKSALIVAASFGVSHFDLATVVHAVPVLISLSDKDKCKVSSPVIEDTVIAPGRRSVRASMTDFRNSLTKSMMNESIVIELSSQTGPFADDLDSSNPFVVQQSMREFRRHLSKAVQDGFLVELSSQGEYKWSHDIIREAFYSLLPEGLARKTLHLEIGRQLRSWMDIQGELGAVAAFSEQQLMLHAVKQLSAGKEVMTDSWELLDLAELSVQAAELAAQQSSFSSAMEYLQLGVECLPSDAWENHYALKLQVSVAYMRIQYTLARLNECQESAAEILDHAKDFKDKRAVYHTILLSMLQQQRFGDGIDCAISMLDRELGIKIPRQIILPRAIMAYLTCNRRFKSMSDEDILAIPPAASGSTLDASEFFIRIFELAFHGSDDFAAYGLFLGVKMMDFLVEHGSSPVTYMAMVVYAHIAIVFGDFETSERFHMLGRTLVDRDRGKYPALALRTVLKHAISATMGSLPVQHSVEAMRNAMTQMWALGALDYVFMDTMDYLRRVFTAGKPLTFVKSECQKHSELLSDYKQSLQWINNAPLHQAVLNFMRRDADKGITDLVGEHMSAELYIGNNPLALYHYQFYKLMLCYHFNDYQGAKAMVKSFPSDIWMSGVAFFVPTRIFYTGLVYAGLCRTTRSKQIKHRFRAQAAMKQLRSWASKGVVNCDYMHYLLEAELLACSGGNVNLAAALKLYDKAIALVKELEILHHIALANELAGIFALINGGGSGLAGSYLMEAVRYFELWGCKAKVHDLKSRYGDIVILGKAAKHHPATSLVSSAAMTVRDEASLEEAAESPSQRESLPRVPRSRRRAGH
jgi:predicted ATPase